MPDAPALRMRAILAVLGLALALTLPACQDAGAADQEDANHQNDREITMSEQEWREKLTPEQYEILREAGTERAFTGQYWNTKDEGTYRCAGCGQPLFSSEDKFDSGTGWPSYTQPVDAENVETRPDNSLFMKRTEVLCKRCGGHLGHVFEDGPEPTGLRYCINSAALDFQSADESAPADESASADES